MGWACMTFSPVEMETIPSSGTSGAVGASSAVHHDLIVAIACGRDEELASPSMRCRFERRAERQPAIAIHQELVERVIATFAPPPEKLVPDCYAADDPARVTKDPCGPAPRCPMAVSSLPQRQDAGAV